MTSLSHEREKQKLWRLKPECAAMRVFDELLENEFKSPADQHAWQGFALRALVGYAVVHVPYYANLFSRLGLRGDVIDTPEDLPRLPVLGKQDVIRFAVDLATRRLPPGERLYGPTKSSGTTGRPVTVLHTERSNSMFSFLSHRNARWFGIDPAGVRLEVRTRRYYKLPDGSMNPDGNVLRWPSWRYLGQFFETGPEYAFNVSNPIEQQVAWLKELRPDYASTDPGVFEEWLLANGGLKPVDSLRVLVSGGSRLTPSLRALLEERYAIPIHEVYGLNEVGIVAVRCEAGRYHVNTEHCLVEIAGEDGQRCAPGQTGRVLVTGLSNLMMPLIRYDTGDLAQAVEGGCPCGRTLPSFGDIAGRYRRYAGLPRGTRQRFQAIRGGVENHAPGELAFLRRYQIHQDRQNRFTLRLRTAGPVPEAFRQNILRAWEPVAGDPPEPLAIVEVDDIAPSPGGKLLDFVSDFHDDPTATPATAPGTIVDELTHGRVTLAKTQAVKTIIFDLDDTLMDERRAKSAYLATLYANHRSVLPYKDEAELHAAWMTVGGRYYGRYINGEFSLQEFRRMVIREVFGRPDMPDSQADRIIEEYSVVHEASWGLYPDAMPVLDALAGKAMGLITNGNHQQQMKKLEHTGILDRFGVVLVSESAGIAKPAPEIFHRACSALGRRPGECVYVGNDWLRDVVGPRSSGLGAIWLTRFGSQVPPQQLGVPQIQNLTELIERDHLREMLGL